MPAPTAAQLDLYRRLRRLIGDPESDTWQNSDLQDSLNEHAYRYVDSAMAGVVSGAGTDFIASYGNWGDAVLRLRNGAIVEPATSDLAQGVWSFTVAPSPYLYVSGVSYDLYAAAADLLENEAAMVKRKFDSTDASGASMKRSQMGKAMLDLAQTYRAKQRLVSVPTSRSDVSPC